MLVNLSLNLKKYQSMRQYATACMGRVGQWKKKIRGRRQCSLQCDDKYRYLDPYLVVQVRGEKGTSFSQFTNVLIECCGSLELTATKGRATPNINSITLHSVFALPVKQKGSRFEYHQPGAERLNSMRAHYTQLKFIAIDEISMLKNQVQSSYIR